MSGWIKIHREIADHWIFQDAEKLKWWIDLLMMASHEEHKTLVGDEFVSLKRGQLMVSLSFLASRWGRSKEKVLDFLRLLESDHMIDRKPDRKSTTITICNYDSYQDASDQVPTANPTDFRPISDQSPTEYKNGEEWKEIDNITNARTSRTREERVEWDDVRESGFAERFKAQGSAILIMRTTGKSPEEVMRLLYVYLASRQIKNLGHKDFNHFLEAFQHAIKNNRISVPVVPSQPKEKKVISGAEILGIYGQ